MNNDISIPLTNTEKYFKLKEYCKSKYGNQNSSDSQELHLIINSINDFKINDIVLNYHGCYRYTTILEYIFRTQNKILINFVITKYINDINPLITINDTLSYDLISVLYANLQHDNLKCDTLTELIFKFETLKFLKEETLINKKISILNYLKKASKSYPCSNTFIDLINNEYMEVFKEQEESIISNFETNIELLKKSILELELVAEVKYKPSERMINFMNKYL